MRPEWYLAEVRDIKNRVWTQQEKVTIFTLRKNNTTVEEVAKKFNASKFQIYNITRIMKKEFKNCCVVCGKNLIKRRNNKGLIKMCKDCKKRLSAYKSSKRKKAIKKNLCGHCEKNPIIPGTTACKKCISATFRRRYKEGLCGRCGKNPIAVDSVALCSSCKNKILIYSRSVR